MHTHGAVFRGSESSNPKEGPLSCVWLVTCRALAARRSRWHLYEYHKREGKEPNVPFPRDLGKYHQSEADGFSESDGGKGGSPRRTWWVLTQSDYVLERVSSASSLPGYQPGLLPVLPAACPIHPALWSIFWGPISVLYHITICLTRGDCTTSAWTTSLASCNMVRALTFVLA